VILGDPANDVPPSDPLMIEAINPRTGANPIIGAALAPANSLDPRANPINGHEYYNTHPTDPATGRDDLQYACIFQLPETRDCSSGVLECDCISSELWKNKPLCNPPTGGPAGTTQYYAKAYPGLRYLSVLRGFGQNSIVASICPKNVQGAQNDPSVGYNPTMSALIARFRSALAP
jgi:hypothetical protein